jgi:hypothetical protein
MEVMDLDLAAIVFAEDGTLLDAAYFNQLSTSADAIRHMGDDTTGLGDAAEDDEVVHVYPSQLPAEVKTVLFVVSCAQSDIAPQDLGFPDKLSFSVYSSETIIPTNEEVRSLKCGLAHCMREEPETLTFTHSLVCTVSHPLALILHLLQAPATLLFNRASRTRRRTPSSATTRS